MTRDVAFAYDDASGRRIVVGLDTKGISAGPSAPGSRAVPLNLEARRELARFLRPLARDENAITHDVSTSTEYETMPNYDRRRTLATHDRRRPFRAMDEGEDPVEFIRELISQLDPDELERLGGDRRRRANDEPEPFPGRPRPGGGMDPIEDARRRARDDDPLAKYRQPGETREHAQDRRRFALDEMSDRHGYGRKAFLERFPGARHISTM